MEDHYSIVIKLKSRMSSDGFYCCFNGKKFKPGEVYMIMCFIVY